jgi:glutamate-1-semialdehyde 2,1-aminomutase
MNCEKSEKLYEKALDFMPGGVNSPVRACKSVGAVPLFIDRACGSKIYDADGNEFIDYVCSWGPNILGHCYPKVIAAVKNCCDRGLTFGACHEGEIRLAQLIRSHFPSMEMLRLVNSGTEAVMSAVRAARGFTGRDKIIKFEGCYHGHSDGLLVKAGSGLLTNAIPNSAGVPHGYTDTTLVARYNDPDSVERLFKQCGEEIACIVVEPCAANMGVVPPKAGFLQFLREITERYGALLIFDEVITGFRLSIGGGQQFYGVTPDLTSLGKIVGGGMPLAVYGGKREIMECVAPLGSVYQAGTLSGNPAAVAAGIATLETLEENPDIYGELDRKSARIEAAMRDVGLNVNRVGSLMTAFFTDKTVEDYDTAVTSDTKAYAEFYMHMREHGIYNAPSQFEAMFVSAAHTDDDIDRTCEVIRMLNYKENKYAR